MCDGDLRRRPRARDEGCDDGDTSSGDGCSAGCDVETGWICAGQPSVCSPESAATACSSAPRRATTATSCPATAAAPPVTIETGWTCTGEPSECDPICGDGLIRGAEECDDGEPSMGDGCSATCEVEPGYVCTGQPSVCVPVRRDHHRAGARHLHHRELDRRHRLHHQPRRRRRRRSRSTARRCRSRPNGTFSTTVALNATDDLQSDPRHGHRARARQPGARPRRRDPRPLGRRRRALAAERRAARHRRRAERRRAAGGDLAGAGLNLATLVPVGTVLVNNECFIDGSSAASGAATVTVVNPPASFASFGLAADSMTNFVAADITSTTSASTSTSTAAAWCRAATSRSTRTRPPSTATTRCSPTPGDPENIDVNQVGALDVELHRLHHQLRRHLRSARHRRHHPGVPPRHRGS